MERWKVKGTERKMKEMRENPEMKKINTTTV